MNWLNSLLRKISEFFFIDSERRRAKSNISGNRLPGESIILVEAWQSAYNQMGISVFLPLLAKKLDARAITYYAMQTGPLTRPKEFLRHLFSFARKSGCSKFHIFSLNTSKNHYRLAKVVLEEMRNSQDPLRSLEKMIYRGVEVGDLIYDQFLRMTESPTLDFSDERLIRIVHDYLLYVDKLKDYFGSKGVKAVIVGETTYRLAIPARVAISYGALAFHVSGSTIYRLNAQTKSAYLEAHYFKSYAEKYSIPDEKPLIHSSPDFVPSIRTREASWTRGGGEITILKEPGKKKAGVLSILVACHDFFDAPHAYGVNLFPDFLVWLDFIGNFSKDTRHKFLIKPHPSERAASTEIFANLKVNYPKLKLLPRSTTNTDLIQMGIDAVLTIFGTVALEYSQFGIPVINASTVSPYAKWNFCLNPNTVEEYANLIHTLHHLGNVNYNFHEVKQFLYLEGELLFKSWLFHQHPEVLNRVRSTSKGYTWDIFRLFDSEFKSSLPNLQKALEKFLESNDYFLHKKHYQ